MERKATNRHVFLRMVYNLFQCLNCLRDCKKQGQLWSKSPFCNTFQSFSLTIISPDVSVPIRNVTLFSKVTKEMQHRQTDLQVLLGTESSLMNLRDAENQ